LEPEASREHAFFWFGPGGTETPLHHDTMNILFAQVVGRKRLLLIPPEQSEFVYNRIGVYGDVDPETPDLERYPLYQRVTPISVEVAPGEMLFLPVGWWHHVRSLEPSITLTFTNFAFPNRYEWVLP
jgi:ribosomal protein L16 Arg81 hydroxylase